MPLRRAQKTWPAPLASIMPTFALKPSESITVLPLFKNSTILQQSRAMRKPCQQTGLDFVNIVLQFGPDLLKVGLDLLNVML